MHGRLPDHDFRALLVQGFDDSDWVSESFFLKVLTKNDDSGRHGVLIPRAAYPLFPPLGAEVAAEEWNPRKPITTWWGNGGDWKPQPSSFIHYSRYPERRITSLAPSSVNLDGERLMVVAKMAEAFEYRCVVATPADESWQLLYDLLVRDGALSDGAFRLISAVNISGPSPAYEELVGRLRAIARLGWVKTVRSGDTGVGMTLEHLLGLAPNSRKDPDYRGIELKAKRVRGKGTGRQTLFAKTPDWNEGGRVALLDEHGSLDGNGRFSIYQSIYAHRKSKEGWRLVYDPGDERLWVTRHGERVVSWRRSVLAKSLETKHRETVFIYAETRGKAAAEEFRFTHALHATGADVERLLRVLNDGAGCHDFAIHRRPDGSVRDHGFLFRVEEIALPEVFREVESYDLLGPERITASEDGDEQELVER